MGRIRIVSRARKHLKNAKAYRKEEAMNWTFAKSLEKGGDFFGSRAFASEAIASRRLARHEASQARKSLLLLYRAKKLALRKGRLGARKVARAVKRISRKL